MPHITIPASLSNAQREDLMSAITRASGGAVSVADSNPNKIAFQRKGLPLHIYQGNEDILAFSAESSVDLLSIHPKETPLGGVQAVIDATKLSELIYNHLSSSKPEHENDIINGIAASLVTSGFEHNSSFSFRDILSTVINSSPELLSDLRILSKHTSAEIRQRFSENLTFEFSRVGYRISLAPSPLSSTSTPSDALDVKTDFGGVQKVSFRNDGIERIINDSIANKLQEKVYLQQLHQYAYQNGISLDVNSEQPQSAYPLSMMRPSALALLRQIYAAADPTRRSQLISNLRYVHKSDSVLFNLPGNAIEEASQFIDRQMAELQSIFLDGIMRAKAQNTSDELINSYKSNWSTLLDLIDKNETSLSKKIEILDIAKGFVVNGGLYSPENRRFEMFRRSSEIIKRQVSSGDELKLIDEANSKQGAWKKAYENIIISLPDEFKSSFLDAVNLLWDDACPGGIFSPSDSIERISKRYAKLLSDTPTVLNSEVSLAMKRIVKTGQDAIGVVISDPDLFESLSKECDFISEQVSKFSTLGKEQKPGDMFTVLRANMELLRVTSQKLDVIANRVAEYQRNRPELAAEADKQIAELDVSDTALNGTNKPDDIMPNSPYRLNINLAKTSGVHPGFIELLSNAVNGADLMASYALTVQEMFEIVQESVDEHAKLDELDIPADFDVRTALDTLQQCGALNVVESIDARERYQRDVERSNELAKAQQAQPQTPLSIIIDSLPANSPERTRLNSLIMEVSYQTDEVERYSFVKTGDDINDKKALNAAQRALSVAKENLESFLVELQGTPPNYTTTSKPLESVIDHKETPAVPDAHTMTRDEWVSAKIDADPYASDIKQHEDTLKTHEASLRAEWVQAVKEQAKIGRVDYRVLDSYVAHYGMTALQSEFRGIYEKGIELYEPNLIRLWDKTYHQLLSMNNAHKLGERKITNVREFHRHVIAKALKNGFDVPGHVLLDYPEVVKSHEAYLESVEPQLENPVVPEVTVDPEVAAVPETIVEPEVAAVPEVIVEPEVVAVPEVIVEPEVAAVPEAIVEPEVAAAPEVIANPGKTEFSDHSDIPNDPRIRPIIIQAEQLLEEASEFMFKDDELVLPDEEEFLMQCYRELFESESALDEQRLKRNLEEFQQIVTPILGVKIKSKITEWSMTSSEILRTQSKLRSEVERFLSTRFPKAELSLSMALLSDTFRKFSAGDNLFLLQTTPQSQLSNITKTVLSEIEKELKTLSVTTKSVNELHDNLQAFNQLRADVRRLALASSENSIALGSAWADLLSEVKTPFGSEQFFNNVHKLQEVISNTETLSTLINDVAPTLRQVDYLKITSEPMKRQLPTESKTALLAKRKTSMDDFATEDVHSESRLKF